VRIAGADITAVLLDMTMPGPSGEETFREIRRLAPRVPVVLTSGYHASDAIERFGAEAFASTEIDVLGLRIKKLLREAASGKALSMQEERRIKMLV